MSVNPTVFKGASIGLQPSLNTGVPADIKLLAPGFGRITPHATGGYMFTGAGNRIPSANVPPGMKWSDWPFEGPMDFIGMLYVLASGLGLPTPSAVGAAGWAWDFYIPLSSAITRQFLTYENGNSTSAEKAINAFANSFVFNASKATQSYSGVMMGGKKQRSITMTLAPDEVTPKIIPPQNFNLYIGSTKAALDTAVSTDNKFPIPLSVVFTIPDLAGMLGRMNSDEDSFFATPEKAVIPTWALKCSDDADFDAFAALLDTGGKQFFALRATGDVINAGTLQVETATVVGTITLAGNVSVIVTAANMTGSPITTLVNVALNDTASQVAGKIRTALGFVTAITNEFTVGGTGATVTLTRRSPALANDATLNIATDNGTSTGLTPAATSANTTAGVAAGVEELRIDFCGAVIEPETPDEEEGAATNTITFQNLYDSAFGRSFNIRLVNTIPSL